MKVLVTGGAGDIGRVTAERLLQNGWDVRVLDRATELDMPGIEYRSGDITDFDTVRDAVRGCNAVVHMAALRTPYMASGPETFRINAGGTYAMYEAAAAEGVKRIAQASSINALGCAWNPGDVLPQYFPIDEDHPTATADPYSFSKHMVEEIGAYYWRRDGITSVSLRFPWVYPAGYLQSEGFQQRREKNRKLLDDLVALNDQDRQAQLADARQHALEFRGERSMEKPNSRDQRFADNPLWAVYTFDRFNFWTFVDVRDAAFSIEQSLTAEYEGHHALFINDPYNWLEYDTRTLIRLFFPQVQQFKSELPGSESLVSIDRARSLIGFESAYSIAGAYP